MYATILFGTVLTVALCCQTYIAFGYSDCAFLVTYTDSACYNFTFNRCEWQQCVAGYTDGQGTYHCTQYQTFYNPSYTFCTNRCCDDGVSYEQNWGAIEQCQDHLNFQFKRGMIIGFSVFGGVVLIAVIICCCCECCENCRQSCCQGFGEFCGRIGECVRYVCKCKCFKRSQERAEIKKEPYTMQMVKPKDEIKYSWQHEPFNNSMINGNTCSVCLENSPSLQLECGHMYHPKCIIACMKRKEECVLCRSTHFNQVKVYCQTCLSAFFFTTLLNHMDQLQQKQECDGCQEANLCLSLKE